VRVILREVQPITLLILMQQLYLFLMQKKQSVRLYYQQKIFNRDRRERESKSNVIMMLISIPNIIANVLSNRVAVLVANL